MINVLIAINTIVFLFLSFLHIYWAVGGIWAKSHTLPVKLSGELALKPSNFGTLIVGLGLLLFAFITLANTGFVDHLIGPRYIHLSTYIIAGIFCIRSIGDFRYVGLMKSVTGTDLQRQTPEFMYRFVLYSLYLVC